MHFLDSSNPVAYFTGAHSLCPACSPGQMWTKLRPAVREFLQRASSLFQLWIHTNGEAQRSCGTPAPLDARASNNPPAASVHALAPCPSGTS